MRFNIESFSLGLDPQNNQDACVNRQFPSGRVFAAVADGVGGHAGGEVASSIATEELARAMVYASPSDFAEIFTHISDKLRQTANESPQLADMATTLTAVLIIEKQAYFAHVGDSRIYHLRNEGITQKTEDQSEGAELVRQGVISASRAKTYARRSVLTSALSGKGDHQITAGSFDIQTNDRLILMTDGLYRIISKRELRDLSVSNPYLPEFSNTLQTNLRVRGLRDDTTAVTIEITQ